MSLIIQLLLRTVKPKKRELWGLTCCTGGFSETDRSSIGTFKLKDDLNALR